MATILLKRAYEPAAKEDGYRILVDRIWPRGISKEELHIDEWLREIAPSTHLRKWFGHDPEKFAEFKHKYLAELKVNNHFVKHLHDIVAQHPVVTLLYGAHDEQHNQAVVLKGFLERR
jgi:DNA-3-methyladenine glycosylase